MANYLMTVDPVLLLNEQEYNDINNQQPAIKNNGQAADRLEKALQSKYDFANVFQSTKETHQIRAHEFMLKQKTGDRTMHGIGKMKTPSGLMSFVTVDDDWLTKHPNEAKAGVYFQLDERIDPKLLHANDGATKDGKTAGFVRYDTYQTPVMAMLPDGPIDKYGKEKVSEMEKAADDRERKLRERKFKLSTVYSAFKRAKSGSAVDAFLVGWNLVDQLKHPEQKQQGYQPRMSHSKEPEAPLSPLPANLTPGELTKSLNELSAREMMTEMDNMEQNL